MLTLSKFLFVIYCVFLAHSLSSASSQPKWTLSADKINLNVTVSDSNDICISSMEVSLPSDVRNSSQRNWTANLLNPECHSNFDSSNTGVRLADSQSYSFVKWNSSTSKVISYTNDTLHLEGLVAYHPTNGSQVLFSEEWVLSLEAQPRGALSWKVKRTYTATFVAASIRHTTFAAQRPTNGRPDGFPYGDAQIWGFLDKNMFLNNSMNGGFFVGKTDNVWYEVLSPTRQQGIHLAPLNDVLEFLIVDYKTTINRRIKSTRAPYFAFGKPSSDGTVDNIYIGVETVNLNSTDSLNIITGNQEYIEVRFRLPNYRQEHKRTYNYPVFNLSLKSDNQGIADLTTDLAETHNQWMGWIFGNNPWSTPCLHEMGWWGMFQVHYSSTVQLELYLKQLKFFGYGGGVDTNKSKVWPRWSIGPPYENSNGGFYAPPWGELQDQVPHLLINAYYAILGLGKSVVQDILPMIRDVSNIMLKRIDPSKNVYICPGSGLNDTGRHASNWYDVIEFGNMDAYINIHVIRAVECVYEIYQYAGDPVMAATFKALHEKMVDAHNSVFWSDEKGMYADWIDIQGNPRYYFYADINMLSIVFGVASQRQAQIILDTLTRREQELIQQYNVSADNMWGTPCNLWKVEGGDCMGGCSSDWPSYENGQIFTHSPGMEIAAWGAAGHPDMAWTKYKSLMLNGYAWNKLYCQAVDWLSGKYSGDPDPLNSAILNVWGMIYGVLGIRLSLISGLSFAESASAAEEARHCFQFIGEITCVCISNGIGQRC